MRPLDPQRASIKMAEKGNNCQLMFKYNCIIEARGIYFTTHCRYLNIRRGTVSDIIVRFKKRGITENKLRSGRPRILDARD